LVLCFLFISSLKEYLMTIIKKTLLAAACVGTLLMAGSAMAADSTTVTVSGDVAGICKFSDAPYAIAFGTLDPSSTGPATQDTTMNYRCTNGTMASGITIDGASNTATALVDMTNGTHHMPATLTWATPSTLGSGFGAASTVIPVTVHGSIAVVDLNAAFAGTYSKSVAVTLAP
jgi:hypothetical protein